MDNRLLGLIILAVWAVPVGAALYASSKRVSYKSAVIVWAGWAITIVGLMLLNYAIADLLGLSKRSSGYVRGRSVVSEYGFVVQLLLIVEIFIVIEMKKWLKREK